MKNKDVKKKKLSKKKLEVFFIIKNKLEMEIMK